MNDNKINNKVEINNTFDIVNDSQNINSKNDFNEIKINSNIENSHISKSFLFSKKVGKTLFLFINSKSEPLFIIGPHYYYFISFCGIITLIYSLFFFIWKYFSKILKIFHIITYIIFFISYSYTSIINPGYPKNNIERKKGGKKYYYCDFCKFYVNNNTQHCFDCDICIEEYDHHCPWTSHCIGKNNSLSFKIFLFSIIVIMGYLSLVVSILAENKKN